MSTELHACKWYMSTVQPTALQDCMRVRTVNSNRQVAAQQTGPADSSQRPESCVSEHVGQMNILQQTAT